MNYRMPNKPRGKKIEENMVEYTYKQLGFFPRFA